MTALHDLAVAAGLHIDWEDARGQAQRVSDEALTAILGALGLPADSPAALAESRRKLADDSADCAFVSGDVGAAVRLPAACGKPGRAELILEDGDRREVVVEAAASGLRIPEIDVAGYHRLILDDREVRLAIAPPRCFTVANAAPDRRLWGPAVQIPSLRDDRRTAYGDFGALAETARAFARRGADAIAISPVHALFPADAGRYSPYAPSSRLFLNVLLGDPALVGMPTPAQPGGDLIDWAGAIPARLRLLREAYDGVRDGVRDAVAAYAREGGEDLLRHARFDALHAHFFAQSGATGWQGWPAEFHDPAGTAVERFAVQHPDEVGFYLFLQWLAKQSLDRAQDVARQQGMALGLIADLAVGMDGGGSHAWSRPDDLLTGLSIGAPPDLLGPDGQNWGITGFSPQALRRTAFEPFIATLRAALDHAGGIRIDHALGLRRLWVTPDGASADQGAYLTMPFEDLLRVIAIESWRAKAVVIGEDLGTVPPGFRAAMDDRAILGMRVLWFERDEGGEIIAPAAWSAGSVAMTGTHDLPTVAGYWQGRDLDWAWKLGRTSGAADEAGDRNLRKQDRERLWKAFTDAGATEAPQPDPEDTALVVDAALAFVASAPSAVAILPMEDVAGLVEQPNLPGTIDEHPNWRRRMPDTTEALLERPGMAARIDLLNSKRGE